MTTETFNQSELVTAAKRNFVVAIGLKPGFKLQHQQVVVVQAHSVSEAKEIAIRKMRVGKFKHMSAACWKFDSVEAVDNNPGDPNV